jgi:hypothetical protein
MRKIDDVRASGHLGGGGPGGDRIAEGHRPQSACHMVDDHAERVAFPRHEPGRLVHQRSDRGHAAPADYLSAREERTQPVGDVDELLSRQPGEEILVAARETHDLVGEHRADDDRHVALDHQPIYPDLDRFVEPSTRKGAHCLRSDRSDTDVGLVIPPGVVDHRERLGADQGSDALVAHGGVGAEGDYDGAGADPGLDCFVNAIEQERQRAAPGGVGDDQAQRAPVEVERVEPGLYERTHFLGFEHVPRSFERGDHRASLLSTARPSRDRCWSDSTTIPQNTGS